ncbi:MAG: hypothetical protein US25_C0008G0012 [Candidatus Moranbacteria bacterium GW2011_GWE1_36_7]|nr:MAG: hypothetical protein UR99_C0001G0030 [Candidatus Moranbacteria bacterium GW2011_GWD2_36_12]KKQ07194.1 MAG: hypothetical protein US16_C0001G0030 [Candidatus Moranbacteria bacterium GW2011_GWE2_36_40]KKQ15252.1 MAG: hypothetical protein US25_C0008G0012 [Candidatus Moranbacteria bacterium GW2011_GWE1_36_7]
MKTKKLFLFTTTLLFLSVFFVRIDSVNNVAKALCWEAYNVCYDNATDDSDVDVCNSVYESCQEPVDIGGNESMPINTTEQPVLGGGVTQQDCNDYAPSDQTCTVNESQTNCDCVYKASDYAYTQSMCDSYYGSGYVVNSDATGCIPKGVKGEECSNGSSWYSSDTCATGYTCNANGICEVSTWGNLTGAGEDSTNAIPAASNVITTTSPTNIIDKKTGQSVAVPAGSTINSSTGAVYSASGSEILPAGTVQMPASSTNLSSGLLFCANGVMATVCETGISGTPVTVATTIGGGYSTGSGLPGATVGASIQAKCGNGFQDVGGICFPMNTGLSSQPIYVIVSNIFSWLMGMFTTLAVLAFVVSGVQYLMAAGNADLAETAKDNAKNALIGIVVGLSGFIIIKAIAAALSGQSIFF